MKNHEILSHVDHTLLKPFASWQDIRQLCSEALTYRTASVCIPPSYIRRVFDEFDVNICTVIGFPNGYSVTAAKLAEIKEALADGASELDMVVNLGDVKNRAFDQVRREIAVLKQAVGDKILKVIVETCYLEADEKIALCRAITDAKADYIKTSTGFGPAGAVMDDIALFKDHIGPNVKIKASGGINTRQDMVDFIGAGCDRLGSSSAVRILCGPHS